MSPRSPSGPLHTYCVNSGPTLPGEPLLSWAAPGSLNVQELSKVWQRRCHLADLGSVSGPWAVEVRDPRSGDRLLVTDPVGVQPLFWAPSDEGHIVAASWLSALVDRPDVDDSLDYEGVLMEQGWDLRGPGVLHRTPFRTVSRVPGGHALRISAEGRTRLERYWDPADLPGPDESLALDECVELLRDRIDNAISRLVAGESAVGGHMSSGIDCTAVTARANTILSERGGGVRAGYSWAPSPDRVPLMPGDERALLAQVAAASALEIRWCPRDESCDWFEALGPTRYPDVTTWYERWTLPQARADGVSVLLSGWGGDELASLNGRGVVRDLIRRGRWLTAWRETSRKLDAMVTPTPVGLRRARALAGASTLALPDAARDALRHPRQARAAARRWDEIDAAIRAYSPLAADTRRGLERGYSAVSNHHEMQLFLLKDGHLQQRTESWYQTGRLFGIDYRYPLLDLGVVEAALRLPWWAFLSNGWSRIAYRLAVADWLPEAVVWNTTKNEPALMARVPGAAPAPSPRRVRGDEQYEAVQRLVRISWQTGSSPSAVDLSAPVVSRPEKAPNLHTG